MSHPTTTQRNRSDDGRARDAGIARPAGIVVSAVIAAGVFIAGQRLLPLRKPEPAPAPVVAPPAPSPVTPPAKPNCGAAHARAAAAGGRCQCGRRGGGREDRRGSTSRKVSAHEDARAGARRLVSSSRSGERRIDSRAQSGAARQRSAREAWRRNRPDVSSAANKTSVLIPIKGSSAGSSSKVFARRARWW